MHDRLPRAAAGLEQQSQWLGQQRQGEDPEIGVSLATQVPRHGTHHPRRVQHLQDGVGPSRAGHKLTDDGLHVCQLLGAVKDS
jgi:hypothetical protein